MDNFLSEIVTEWTVEELTRYIDSLEVRMKETHTLLKELKDIRRTKVRRNKLPDNGIRGGN